MRHAKIKHRLNRFTSWRKATLIGLTKSLILHQSVRTTKAKAKATQVLAERLISLGRQNTLAAKRRAFSILGEHRLVSILFDDIAVRFQNKSAGYTRVIQLGNRRGDSAPIAILELTEIKKKERRPAKEKKETKPEQDQQQKAQAPTQEKPPLEKKAPPTFLGGIRRIFKKERDAL
jgi:large subunit ribosomal protein L17